MIKELFSNPSYLLGLIGMLIVIALIIMWLIAIVSVISYKIKNPETNFLWIILIFIVPVIGAVIYFFVFKSKIRAWIIVGLILAIFATIVTYAIVSTIKAAKTETIVKKLHPKIDGYNICVNYYHLFEMYCPDNWNIDVKQSSSSITIKAPIATKNGGAIFGEDNAYVYIKKVDKPNFSVDDQLESVKSKVEDLKKEGLDFQIEISDTQIDGIPAKKVEYKKQGEKFMIGYFLMKNDSYYQITYDSNLEPYDKFFNTANYMIESIRFFDEDYANVKKYATDPKLDKIMDEREANYHKDFTVFKDDKYNFQIDYPKGAISYPSSSQKLLQFFLQYRDLTRFYGVEDGGTNITVEEKNLSGKETIDQYINNEKKYISWKTLINIFNILDIQIDNLPGKKIEYSFLNTFGPDNHTIYIYETKVLEILVAKNDKLVILTYANDAQNFDRFIDIVEHMISSLKLK